MLLYVCLEDIDGDTQWVHFPRSEMVTQHFKMGPRENGSFSCHCQRVHSRLKKKKKKPVTTYNTVQIPAHKALWKCLCCAIKHQKSALRQ